MKILIFTTAYFPMIGGAEVAIKEVTDRVQDVEFHLYCAKLRKDTKRLERMGNVVVHRVGFGGAADKYLLPILGPLSALRATSHGLQATIWSVMASYGGFAGLFLSWMKPAWKFVLTLQEGDPVERYEKRAGIFNGLRKKIFSEADQVHTISRFLAAWAKNMGAKHEPIVIPNGVDIPLFSQHQDKITRESMREALGLAQAATVLVTASRLSHKNGLDDVIRALPLLPDDHVFLVLGTGEDKDILTRLVHTLALESRVLFKGDVDHAKLPSLLHAGDIFIRPSRSEGLGNAFLEAMAAGLPVIGTPVGGIPDFLLDGETGIFCEPDNPESIADAVMKLQNTALRDKLVEQGRKLVIQKYDWESITERMKGMLQIEE